MKRTGMKTLLILTAILTITGLKALNAPTYSELVNDRPGWSNKNICLYLTYGGSVGTPAKRYSNILPKTYKTIKVKAQKNEIEILPIVTASKVVLEKLENIDPYQIVSFMGAVKYKQDRRTKIKDYYYLVTKIEEGIVVSEDLSEFKKDEYKEASMVRLIIQSEQFVDSKIFFTGNLKFNIDSKIPKLFIQCTDISPETHYRLLVKNIPFNIFCPKESEDFIKALEEAYIFQKTVYIPKKDELIVPKKDLSAKFYGVFKSFKDPSKEKSKPQLFFYLTHIEILK